MNDIEQNILSDFIEPPKPANIGKRMLAAILDGILLVFLFYVFGKIWGQDYRETNTTTTTSISITDPAARTSTETTTTSGVRLNGWPLVAYMVAWFFIIPFMEGKTGQTLGKRLLQIKVIRQSGEPTNVGRSFIRHLFDGIDCIFVIGLIIALTNPKKARIGDMVAATYVVEKTS